MRRYEQVYILRPSLSEEQITKIIENTNQLILNDDGAIIFLNKWGMRKLAYPIKKAGQGYYVLCDFAASPGVVSEIERKFRIDDSILKYLTIKVTDSITAEEIEVAQSEAEAKAIIPEPEEAVVDTADQKPVKETKEEPAEQKPVEETTEEPADAAAQEPVEAANETPEETVGRAGEETEEEAETADDAEESVEDSEEKTQ